MAASSNAALTMSQVVAILPLSATDEIQTTNISRPWPGAGYARMIAEFVGEAGSFSAATHPNTEVDMNLMRSIRVVCGQRVVIGLASIVVMAAASPLLAHGDDRRASPVGTWGIEVQVRNCQSNAPIGPPFLSLITLHSGGTLSETSGAEAAFAIGQRSPGHGAWEKVGHQLYELHLISLVLFETGPNLPGSPGFNPALPVGPGFFKGWDTVTQTLRFTNADHFTSIGTSAFFKADGTLYREGCSTAIGQRVD